MICVDFGMILGFVCSDLGDHNGKNEFCFRLVSRSFFYNVSDFQIVVFALNVLQKKWLSMELVFNDLQNRFLSFV